MSFLSTLVPTIFSRISSSCWMTISWKSKDCHYNTERPNQHRKFTETILTYLIYVYVFFVEFPTIVKSSSWIILEPCEQDGEIPIPHQLFCNKEDSNWGQTPFLLEWTVNTKRLIKNTQRHFISKHYRSVLRWLTWREMKQDMGPISVNNPTYNKIQDVIIH